MIKNSYINIAENDLEYLESKLDTIGLAYLTDFYYDARYPGDDFYTVTKDDFEKCLSIMYDTVNKLNH